MPYPTLRHLRLVLQDARERPYAIEHWWVGRNTAQLVKRAKHHGPAMTRTESKDYLVTRTNLGEIRFDWERKEAIQGLWYPAASDNDQASVAVARYRASLDASPTEAAPPLP